MKILLGVLGTQEIILLGFIMLGIVIIPMIFFLITQQNTLKNIRIQNRTMSPGEVWLQLIPFFGLVWQFIVVGRISDSIRREMASENTLSFEQTNRNYSNSYGTIRPTYDIGITYCVLFCCSIIPIIGGLAYLAGLICWIIYWVRLSEYKNKLEVKRYTELSSTPGSQ
jgi:hypothetical protein